MSVEHLLEFGNHVNIVVGTKLTLEPVNLFLFALQTLFAGSEEGLTGSTLLALLRGDFGLLFFLLNLRGKMVQKNDVRRNKQSKRKARPAVRIVRQ